MKRPNEEDEIETENESKESGLVFLISFLYLDEDGDDNDDVDIPTEAIWNPNFIAPTLSFESLTRDNQVNFHVCFSHTASLSFFDCMYGWVFSVARTISGCICLSRRVLVCVKESEKQQSHHFRYLPKRKCDFNYAFVAADYPEDHRIPGDGCERKREE